VQQLKERIDTIRNEYLKRLGEFRGNDVLSSCPVEKVLEERDKLLVNKINLERELFDAKKELKFIKHTKTECESHLKILRIKMQEQNERRSSSRSPRKAQQNNSGKKSKLKQMTFNPFTYFYCKNNTFSFIHSHGKYIDSNHVLVVGDKMQTTEAAATTTNHNDSLMDDVENNSSAGEQSKKSEEIAECKQQ